MDFKKLGHSPLVICRLTAVKQILESAVSNMGQALKDVNFDTDSKMTITMLEDAIEVLKKGNNYNGK